MFDSTITKVRSADPGHVCGDAKACVKHMHVVQIIPSLGSRAPLVELEADLILIRHGIETYPPVLNGPLPVTDQILPLEVPSHFTF